jgi:hypothetical protein
MIARNEVRMVRLGRCVRVVAASVDDLVKRGARS